MSYQYDQYLTNHKSNVKKEKDLNGFEIIFQN